MIVAQMLSVALLSAYSCSGVRYSVDPHELCLKRDNQPTLVRQGNVAKASIGKLEGCEGCHRISAENYQLGFRQMETED